MEESHTDPADVGREERLPESRQPSPSSLNSPIPSSSRSPSLLGCGWWRRLWRRSRPWADQGLVVKKRDRPSRLRPSKQRKPSWHWGAATMVVRRRKARAVAASGIAVLVFLLFLVNMWFFSTLQEGSTKASPSPSTKLSLSQMPLKEGWKKFRKSTGFPSLLYARLLALAAHALAEGDGKPEPPDLWKEPKDAAAAWTPCAEKRSSETPGKNNGYMIVTANGGINQQRVAICNAVAVTRLLNATLVIPKFQYSNVWRDRSQFGDIYQEEYFINYLKPDIQIVKELPLELQSLDLEAIGSLVNDSHIIKEAKPSFFLKKILPILLKNRVVHFVGFGNRLASDPVPFKLQRLRCRCNFHALQFVSRIQEAGALLVHRMRKHALHSGPLEHNLVGQFSSPSKGNDVYRIKHSRYLAVHLRFEIDMAAYSLCYFGGGNEEEEELEAYRMIHFPALAQLKKTVKFAPSSSSGALLFSRCSPLLLLLCVLIHCCCCHPLLRLLGCSSLGCCSSRVFLLRMPSAAELRSEGQCPLTPEEAILMIAALGFKRESQIYFAGAHVYGGKLRMAALHSLYPNIVTKETLLSPHEIDQFINHTSQLAALDFIACVAADAFAITDSGSQFSALVSGYRMYYGGGGLPTIRPNKRRLASIFVKNSTIEWRVFEKRVRKAVRQNKRVIERPIARSIYRHPRCRDCMCRIK